MAVYVKTYDLSKVKWIPEEDYQWCRRNNFDSGRKSDLGYNSSCIKMWLFECVENGEGFLFIAHDGTKNVGWALCYEHDGKMEFQVYVPPRQRRRGIGSRLLSKAVVAAARVGFRRVEVFSHDVSNPFYVSNGLTKTSGITGKRLKKMK